MTPNKIRITLKSAATFSRGDGVAGLVDREIEHDDHGFPFLRGKTLKGLLVESGENILYALGEEKRWKAAKERLFGKPGKGVDERGIIHIGDAVLPSALRSEALKAGWTGEDILYSLTGIRRQTAINPDGAPDHASLRSMRVLLPGITLEAEISFDRELKQEDLPFLTASILDFRRAGTGRNRGRGWLSAELQDDTTTKKYFDEFAQAV